MGIHTSLLTSIAPLPTQPRHFLQTNPIPKPFLKTPRCTFSISSSRPLPTSPCHPPKLASVPPAVTAPLRRQVNDRVLFSSHIFTLAISDTATATSEDPSAISLTDLFSGPWGQRYCFLFSHNGACWSYNFQIWEKLRVKK
jgi:hypothetical protein